MRYTVLSSSKSAGIASGLTYESAQHLELGQAVQIPLRRSLVEGIIIDAQQTREQEEFDVKRVHALLHNTPLLPAHSIRLLRWIAEEYMCSLRQAMGVFLPAQRWSVLLPQPAMGYVLAQQNPHDVLRGSKQIASIEYLNGRPWVSEQEMRDATGVGPATLKALVQKGWLLKVTEPGGELDRTREPSAVVRPHLTQDQAAVAEDIRATRKPVLLFGITGSGKTEVYAELIADEIEKGNQALLLVPEILLTEHSILRFQQLLPRERIAIVHSRLTPAERRDLWRHIRSGDIDLVIGSRSALFSPLERLGLIVIDEEHEWTYKNEQTPRYHTRETAQELCRLTGARLLLGSATPLLESWSRAKAGTYELLRLPTRYGNHALPSVRIVDLASVEFGSLYPFSPPLLEAMRDRLARKEQVVLFLNRRGLATALLCLECRRRVVSPDSQLPFTVHANAGGGTILVDHTTNLAVAPPTLCPHCESPRLLQIGAGTQRIERILRDVFPNAHLRRVDKDTISDANEIRTILSSMKEGRTDILVGTQSVVKGLDVPGVTLAAVLLADVGLSLPHFRAGERVFQLLTQLVGRSGRAKPGEVIIQTYRPDALEVRSAAKHRTEEYLDAELSMRIHAGYPPASRMVRLLLRGERARERTISLCAQLQEINTREERGLFIGCAPTLFGGNRLWHILLRGAQPKEILRSRDLQGAIVDVDPMECI